MWEPGRAAEGSLLTPAPLSLLSLGGLSFPRDSAPARGDTHKYVQALVGTTQDSSCGGDNKGIGKLSFLLPPPERDFGDRQIIAHSILITRGGISSFDSWHTKAIQTIL